VEHIQPRHQHVCDILPQTKQHNLSNKAHNSPIFRLRKCFSLFPRHSTQWRPLFLNGVGLIQVDIGGHPPVQNSILFILKVFYLTRFSIMQKFLFNYGLFTYGAVPKPYRTSKWILVASHLFQLAYFGSFHVNTYFCTSRVVLGL
jgi:hypothetical protein